MNERLYADMTIRHALGAQGVSNTTANKIVRILNSADADLVAQIAARYAVIDKAGYDRGPATTARLNDLLQAIRTINTEVYQKLADNIEPQLTDMAEHEADFAAKAAKKAGVSEAVSPPSSQFLQTLVTQSPIDGRLLSSWVDGLSDARMDRLEQAIRIGLVNGETTDSLVQRIRGTKAAAYQDGILNISRKSAQTFALTASSTVQNNARLETFRQMRGIAYVEWSSILDSRTSSICQSLSGQIWPIDGPHPSPPAHPRCRSILLPRKNDTDAPLHKTYDAWLAGQSAAVQDKALGSATRGKLFRDGKVKASDLYRPDGSFKTLDELKADDHAMTA